MRKMALLGAWSLVVVLTTTLTWQIVGAADAQVSERPASPLNVAAPVFNPSVPEPTTTTPPSLPTSTSVADSTDSTGAMATTTTTTSIPTTTATISDWSLETVSTAGGLVVLKYRPGEVVLQTTTPAPGFRAEIEKSGPPEVEVELESESTKFEIHAKWESGQLAVEVSESGED